MTGWAADRHITPRVIDYLADHLHHVDVMHRPSLLAAQCVLRAQCRWARREPGGEHAGMWLADDTVGQLQANTGIAPGTIRNVLRALEHVGLNVTLSNGGGKGEHARGATRRLVLDPVDGPHTPRGNHAEYQPVLRVVGVDTPRGKARTPRGQPRDTALQPRVLRKPRAGDASEVHTAPPRNDAARTTYAEYAAKAKADGKRVLTPAVYFAMTHTDDATEGTG